MVRHIQVPHCLGDVAETWGDRSFWTNDASWNPVNLDDEAIELPPYIGFHQWAAGMEAAANESTVSSRVAPNLLPNLAASESVSGGPCLPTSRNPKASAYVHNSVHIPIT